MYTVVLLLTMYPSIMDMIQVKIKFMLKFVDSPNYSWIRARRQKKLAAAALGDLTELFAIN